MNYLTEPRGAAVPFGMYQDLGALSNTERGERAWKYYQAQKFERLVQFIGKYGKKKIRNYIYEYLKKKGVSDKDLKALKSAVNSYRAQKKAASSTAATSSPNYLLWGGVALAAVAGGYFLFFRKRKAKR